VWGVGTGSPESVAGRPCTSLSKETVALSNHGLVTLIAHAVATCCKCDIIQPKAFGDLPCSNSVSLMACPTGLP
jgi:hypothetical protein